VPTRRFRQRHRALQHRALQHRANTTRNRSSTGTVRPGSCDLLMTAILPTPNLGTLTESLTHKIGIASNLCSIFVGAGP